jgi:hypothetical protein
MAGPAPAPTETLNKALAMGAPEAARFRESSGTRASREKAAQLNKAKETAANVRKEVPEINALTGKKTIELAQRLAKETPVDAATLGRAEAKRGIRNPDGTPLSGDTAIAREAAASAERNRQAMTQAREYLAYSRALRMRESQKTFLEALGNPARMTEAQAQAEFQRLEQNSLKIIGENPILRQLYPEVSGLPDAERNDIYKKALVDSPDLQQVFESQMSKILRETTESAGYTLPKPNAAEDTARLQLTDAETKKTSAIEQLRAQLAIPDAKAKAFRDELAASGATDAATLQEAAILAAARASGMRNVDSVKMLSELNEFNALQLSLQTQDAAISRMATNTAAARTAKVAAEAKRAADATRFGELAPRVSGQSVAALEARIGPTAPADVATYEGFRTNATADKIIVNGVTIDNPAKKMFADLVTAQGEVKAAGIALNDAMKTNGDYRGFLDKEEEMSRKLEAIFSQSIAEVLKDRVAEVEDMETQLIEKKQKEDEAKNREKPAKAKAQVLKSMRSRFITRTRGKKYLGGKIGPEEEKEEPNNDVIAEYMIELGRAGRLDMVDDMKKRFMYRELQEAGVLEGKGGVVNTDWKGVDLFSLSPNDQALLEEVTGEMGDQFIQRLVNDWNTARQDAPLATRLNLNGLKLDARTMTGIARGYETQVMEALNKNTEAKAALERMVQAGLIPDAESRMKAIRGLLAVFTIAGATLVAPAIGTAVATGGLGAVLAGAGSLATGGPVTAAAVATIGSGVIAAKSGESAFHEPG